MSPDNGRRIIVTENIASWIISDPRKANSAMTDLAQTYLVDDRFPQGDNEEISLLCSGSQISLRVSRSYNTSALSIISPETD